MRHKEPQLLVSIQDKSLHGHEQELFKGCKVRVQKDLLNKGINKLTAKNMKNKVRAGGEKLAADGDTGNRSCMLAA